MENEKRKVNSWAAHLCGVLWKGSPGSLNSCQLMWAWLAPGLSLLGRVTEVKFPHKWTICLIKWSCSFSTSSNEQPPSLQLLLWSIPEVPVQFHMTFSWGRILPDHQFLISLECLLKSALRRDPGRTQQVFITYSENLPSPLPGHSLPGASPSHLQGNSESFAHVQSLQRPSLRSMQFLTRAKMALYYSIFFIRQKM